MTLFELLSRFAGDTDINVLDPDKPNSVTYIPGEGAVIPKALRDRVVDHFKLEDVSFDKGAYYPILVVSLKGAAHA